MATDEKKPTTSSDIKDGIQDDKVSEKPGEIVMRMSHTEDRRSSNVKWTNLQTTKHEIFRTGKYPHLTWDLYECQPDLDRSKPPTPDDVFRHVKDLGHGSFGKVRLVEMKLTNERLAMKVMEKEGVPRTLRMKELQAFIQIGESPFIVRYHSCFETDTSCYILMQYHCGGSLAKIIEEFGALPESTTRFFAAEMVEGLLHLHERLIIHRDIKLANILLGLDNHVRICDMGLCKLGMNAKSQTHTRCGALRYCAPEVLSREWYNKDVDWWSLGVVIFRMLTGQYPFDSDSRDDVEELIKKSPPNMSMIPPEMTAGIDLLTKFLVKKPDERLGSGEVAVSGQNIRTHPFFKDIDWEGLKSRTLHAPTIQKRYMRRGSVLYVVVRHPVVRILLKVLLVLLLLTLVQLGIYVAMCRDTGKPLPKICVFGKWPYPKSKT